MDATDPSSKIDKRPCIIAVDDTRVLLSTLIAQFEKIPALRKYKLLPCQNTDDAFESLLTRNVVLVLLDWNLQNDMSGLDFLKRLSGTEIWNNIPVIMITVEGRKEKIMEAIKNGAKAYMVKPFDKVTLIDKINSLVKVKKKIKPIQN